MPLLKPNYVADSSDMPKPKPYEFLELPKPDQILAGEINDLQKRNEWQEFIEEKEFRKIRNRWKLKLGEKNRILVTDTKGLPLVNVKVEILDGKKTVSAARTDLQGEAVFFLKKGKSYAIRAMYNGKIQYKPPAKSIDGFRFEFERSISVNNNLDVMFMADATASIGVELHYLQSKFESIISRIDSNVMSKKIALTFYRDVEDRYVVRDFDFSSDIEHAKKNLLDQEANGGDDYEEALEKALEKSMNMSWRENATTRLLFLLLDAPPHFNDKNVKIIHKQLQVAKEKGIKIIPILGSYSDRTTECLMRYFSAYTNGTYIFVADNEGIGNSRWSPTTEFHKVEYLDDLIVRLINGYTKS